MSKARRGTNFDLERLDALRIEGTRGEAEICEFHVASRVDKEVLSWVNRSEKDMSFTRLIAYLRLEISMNVSKLVQLGDSCEHFADVKACMFLFEYTRVI